MSVRRVEAHLFFLVVRRLHSIGDLRSSGVPLVPAAPRICFRLIRHHNGRRCRVVMVLFIAVVEGVMCIEALPMHYGLSEGPCLWIILSMNTWYHRVTRNILVFRQLSIVARLTELLQAIER